eukprot:846758_1
MSKSATNNKSFVGDNEEKKDALDPEWATHENLQLFYDQDEVEQTLQRLKSDVDKIGEEIKLLETEASKMAAGYLSNSSIANDTELPIDEILYNAAVIIEHLTTE